MWHCQARVGGENSSVNPNCWRRTGGTALGQSRVWHWHLWKCCGSPGVFKTHLQSEALTLDPLRCQLGCAVMTKPRVLCRVSQCHQWPPCWEWGVQGAAWPGTAEQDGGSCSPCPRLLLKLTETICGHRSPSRAPGDSGGWGSESPSPRRGHGQRRPPGRPPSSRREEMGSQLPLERDQERFRLLS